MLAPVALAQCFAKDDLHSSDNDEAEAGIQIQPMRVWILFFKGMTERRENDFWVFRNSK